MIADILSALYPWTKALHIISVITWMAGLFYLPRLFVYHAEKAAPGTEMSAIFQEMERKLLRLIMNPAMIATWVFGLMLAFTPGVVDWTGDGWFHAKLLLVMLMTAYHHALGLWRKQFARDANTRPGRFYRLWNEAPTLLMIGIVLLVVLRPF
ncbi:protoporphyrinogen oxidase HemJ [Paroceanicella profunda]|uniref:Protoporphyrinogen IX oxidase n=1 Tax=Paroceanicella profunda TaxID=2579971 RepID=A0A5B8FRE9_9RHOB|nr:protoporphyrinogen oxidase HemJ [Paroceanicella profunda]QDL91306.1 protoporphyrinogen oxidase HemJ [Paroceanicella profunda]